MKDKGNMIKAVIFDMDGTILNTLDDLANAINYALKSRNHSCDFDNDIVRMLFGSGIRVAFERALAVEEGCPVQELELIGTKDYHGKYGANKEQNDELDKLMEIYLPYYNEHCNDTTRAYEGIIALLKELRKRKIKTAVVSNKPNAAVQTLCEQLFNGMFDYSLGEMEGVKRKPARDMVDMCLNNLGVETKEAIYVGDSEIDLLTAYNSCMPCIAVTWGFRGREFLEKHEADIIIDAPEELLAWLENTQSIINSGKSKNKDKYKLLSDIIKYINKNYSIDKIQKKTGANKAFIEDVTRMYLTHQSIDPQGILDRIEIKNK